MCDFKKALHKAICEKFDATKINGCLFHMKKVLHKKMCKIRFSPEVIEMVMTKISWKF